MNHHQIKELYKTIFESYDKPSLQKHIEKIIEMDSFLPYSSTFFCITNTQDLTFEYISKNYASCTGLDPNELKNKGMRHLWSRIHPDDVEAWLKALNNLMEYTMGEISESKRQDANYTWNFRFKIANGDYVNIVQNTTPLVFDASGKPIIGLAHYTVLHPDIKMEITASAKLLNDNKEYETVYFNNFSQKLLDEGISNRERDVIRLLVLNNTSKEISDKLNISPHTVDTHRRNILKKLNISSTGELVGMLKVNQHWL
ncbi:MAG: helix-turn-helix transcriptional regulator [Flavobacteriaceae bacterium]|uniref:LuxR C-terminal-related transcriptional regulator n=1 Tax=Winogradskyella sp. SYSU M77433 TaxID=3042722 RepID=UPI000C61A977|nr:LuxR C-terminal-related transcriptional regulator [Winogradskyella sp. SYSU M77433]MAX70340.1 helix-turn-helix transcriptional regulator [Flavobacteriaceae bacterium]MDH7912461.1 LuxR C-terminal-related transcriptional regulator [Winogradskyella sp. SYSU M77433]